MKTIELYTDGSCLGNQDKDKASPGGYGLVLLYKDHKKTLCGPIKDTTNVRAEMIAVIKGLEALKEKCKVNLYTDSQLIVNTMTKNWKRNKNTDLWLIIDNLNNIHDIHWHWVKSHNGNTNNEIANTLAQSAAAALAIELSKIPTNYKIGDSLSDGYILSEIHTNNIIVSIRKDIACKILHQKLVYNNNVYTLGSSHTVPSSSQNKIGKIMCYNLKGS